MLQDIGTLDDIKQLVNRFYDQVRADTLLGPVFETRIENRWPKHLEKMYSFWQTVLLGEHTYEGRPFSATCGVACRSSAFCTMDAIVYGYH